MLTVGTEFFTAQGKQRLFYMTVFLAFLALYAWTAQRGVSWQDSGEFQYRVLAGDYRWFSGIARAHPLYILMAKTFASLFPAKACFFAVNLFSGVGMACALVFAAASVIRLTRSVWPAAVTVSLLGFAHMAWWMGTIAEVYTWSLAFLMAEVYCAVRHLEQNSGYWLVALSVVNGAHFAVHNLALVGLPIYVLLLLGHLVARRENAVIGLIAAALGWCAAAGMIIGQAGTLLWETGSPLLVLRNVLFGDGYERLVLGTGGGDARTWGLNVGLAGLSVVNPCWVFSMVGLIHMRVFTGWKWLLALTGLHLLFWIRYLVPDQATFVLPTLGLMAIWGGLGAASLKRMGMLRLIMWTAIGAVCSVVCPQLASLALGTHGVALNRPRTLPFRHDVSYWALPWKQNEKSAERFVQAVNDGRQAGDVIVADATAAGPLMAAREAGQMGRDWRLITPWSNVADAELQALVAQPAVRLYVVSPVRGYMPRALADSGCAYVPEGVLYRARAADKRP